MSSSEVIPSFTLFFCLICVVLYMIYCAVVWSSDEKCIQSLSNSNLYKLLLFSTTPNTHFHLYTFFHQFTSLFKTTLIPSHQPNKKGNLLEIAGRSSSIEKSIKKNTFTIVLFSYMPRVHLLVTENVWIHVESFRQCYFLLECKDLVVFFLPPLLQDSLIRTKLPAIIRELETA